MTLARSYFRNCAAISAIKALLPEPVVPTMAVGARSLPGASKLQ